MARRGGLWVALLLFALVLLTGLGLFTGVGVPAWLRSGEHDGDSLELEAPPGELGASPERGPRLAQAPQMPAAAKGAASVAVTGPRITGRVVDAAGRGVAGARVVSIPDTNGKTFALDQLGREGTPGFTTTADAEGRFAVRVSKEAPYHIVLADGPGLGFAGRGHLPIGSEVTIKLAAALAMAGRVLDVKGQPVSGARVRALLLIDTLEHTPETTSGPDGAYRLEGLPAAETPTGGEWAGYMQTGEVEVTAEGFSPLLANLMPYGEVWKERQDWILQRGAMVVGRVEDAETGAPIPGANVAVHSTLGMQGYSRGPGLAGYSSPWSPRLLARTTAAADGSYRVEHLPASGTPTGSAITMLASGKRALGGVSAWAPGYAAQAQNLEVAADGAELERVFRLVPASGRVTGRVVESTGQPVEGVSIWVVADGAKESGWIPPVVGEVPRAGASTGADGRFVIEGAPGGRKEPVAASIKVHAFKRGVDRQPRQVERALQLAVGAAVDVGDLVLPEPPPPYETTTVVVSTRDGSPVYGAYVGQSLWGGGMRTDAEGRMTVQWPRLVEGQTRQPIHLLATAPGFAPTPLTLTPPPDPQAPVRVTIEPGYRVGGRVVRPDGSPAAATQLLLANGNLDPRNAFPERMDDAFQRAGQVPREGGMPALYFVLHTDKDGAFLAKDLPPGPYHVRAFGTRRVAPPPGTPPLAVTVTGIASDTLDFVVRLPEDDSPATGGLLVRVLDATTREPVLDAMLWARVDGRVVGTAGSRGVPGGAPPPPPSPGPPSAEPSGPGREPGTYRLMNLPVGRVDLDVQSAGRRLERVAGVEVVADRVGTVPDVRLTRGTCVAGRVDVPKGERAVDRQVLFRQEGAPDDAPQLLGPLAADGSFSVCGFAPGTYRVQCLPQGFAPQALVVIPAASTTVVVPEGAADVQVEGPWIVAGTLSMRPDDARLPPAPWDSERGTPERQRFGAATRVTVTGPDGRTVVSVQPVARHWLGNQGFLYLPPGRYVARIHFPEGETREETVDLQPGAQVDISFRKKP